MTSSLHEKVAGNEKRTPGVQAEYSSAWQTLKSKSEAQIRENGRKISKFKTQREKGSRAFRPTYDRRVAELERRNIALQVSLNDFKGDRSDARAEFK